MLNQYTLFAPGYSRLSSTSALTLLLHKRKKVCKNNSAYYDEPSEPERTTVPAVPGRPSLTCQAVVALDLGALHGSPLLLGQLGRGLAQQVDLGARRPVHNMNPFQLEQRTVVLAYRLPEFLLLVAAVALRFEVDGFLNLQLHLHFGRAGSIPAVSSSSSTTATTAASSSSSSGGRCQATTASLRVALQAFYLVLFGFHVSQWTQLERAIVLGVFRRGVLEQRAVHKGCGIGGAGRQAGGTELTGSVDKIRKKRKKKRLKARLKTVTCASNNKCVKRAKKSKKKQEEASRN